MAGRQCGSRMYAVQQFLVDHVKIRFHFTPSYSSWLNQVELWFAKVQRDRLACGIFTSGADLGRKIRKYIRACANALISGLFVTLRAQEKLDANAPHQSPQS
jgi:hypothetical protein